ncbi:MAG TPA: hypothetical protein DCZ04_07895 [Syntrophorhabdus aromaticivorans]|nr:hypothetical protein [Syntrophorhabdus aromaticivorans]
MSVHIKLTGHLYDDIVEDLERPHPFAEERVGFVFGRMTSLSDGAWLILLARYRSIPDDQYIKDQTVGARIGKEALVWAMQAVYYGRATREGIFHIHIHPYKGEPNMSRVDRRDLPKLIPGFQSVGSEAPHGIIILSSNHGAGWVWLPENREPVIADTIGVIGVPLNVFERRILK